FTFHLKPFQCFVAAKNILDGTGHYMMNSRSSVGRRRTFIKSKRRFPFSALYRSLKYLMLFPVREDLFSYLCKINVLLFFIFHSSIKLFCFLFSTKIRRISISSSSSSS